MNTLNTSRTATPAEVDRVLAQAQALRSAYIAQGMRNLTARLRKLFNRAPRGAVAA